MVVGYSRRGLSNAIISTCWRRRCNLDYINARGSEIVGEGAGFGPPYCDVDGDDLVVAVGVLKIINFINSGNSAEGVAARVLLNGVRRWSEFRTRRSGFNQICCGGRFRFFSLFVAVIAAAQAKQRQSAV